MAKYARLNFVDAKPMTRGDFFKVKGAECNPALLKDKGYFIVYRKGQKNEYISWCPKAEFDAVSYRDNKLPFGIAMFLCQTQGVKIARANWNGKGQFVRFEKVFFFEDGNENGPAKEKESDCFVFHCVNMKTGEKGVQVGWLASQGDMKSADWYIVK